MKNSSYSLLNSIFFKTHQELQTLQNDFLNLQIHFVNFNYKNSQLENYNEILKEDENNEKEICLQAFKFIYKIRSTKIENIRAHLSQEDIKARIYKSTGKSSHTAIPFFTIIKIINFILSYANKWGLPSP
ncbi:21313_t:CDS:2, partial [Cetraspora pellucida]